MLFLDSGIQVGVCDAVGFPATSNLLQRGAVLNTCVFCVFSAGGHLRYIFVVESMKDPCIPIIRNLQATHKECPSHSVILACSGESRHCSQKIHNLIHGIRYSIKTAEEPHGYIVCMDDDVQPHPEFLETLISDMERTPDDTRVATAYPFDIPQSKGASLFSYAMLAYHLPLSVGLAISTRTRFVWGGCMAFRMEDMAVDRFGILSSWSRGGYSDDLTVAARLGKLNQTIFCPGTAVFPQWIPDHVTMKEYWNYLRRQLFVLDTYSDVHNKLTNYSLVCLFIYGSVGFVGPTMTIPLRLVIYMVQYYTSVTGNGVIPLHTIWWFSVAVFCAGAVYMTVTLQRMINETARLLEILHKSEQINIVSRISWTRLLVGFWLSNVISPVCLMYTLLTRHIVWSGITYVRNQGKVMVHTRNEFDELNFT